MKVEDLVKLLKFSRMSFFRFRSTVNKSSCYVLLYLSFSNEFIIILNCKNLSIN